MTAQLRGRYSPADPVAYGAPVACPNETTGVTSAVTGTNAELMAMAAQLWITDSDLVIDVTAGLAVFWKQVKVRVAMSDIAPRAPGTVQADCRALPYASGTVDVAVLDPPYQPMHGDPRRSFGVGNTYASGATGLQTISDVLGLYEAGISELARVLRPGGRAMVKCQDMTYNHRLHLVHLDVLRMMAAAGIDLADMLVLVNTSRMPQPTRRQQRAHRSHSCLLIGVRCGE